MYKLLIFFVVLIALPFCSSATCRYQFLNENYHCELINAYVELESYELVIAGEHLTGMTDQDVRTLFTYDSRMNFISKTIFTKFPNLVTTFFQYMQLKEIRAETFFNCSQLTGLWLDSNELTNLPGNVFEACPKLLTLSLTSNDITSIHNNAFVGLTDLEKLSLIDNKLTFINTEMFTPLPNLQHLELSHNLLTTLPQDLLVALPRLEELLLVNNEFIVLPILQPSLSLKSLYLSENHIRTIDGALQQVRSLEFLDLEFNEISAIQPSAFTTLNNLWHLRLDRNRLNIATLGVTTFNGLASLTELNLAENNFSSIESSLLQPLPQLEILDLSWNQLTSLPLSLFTANSGLKYLNLEDNNFTSIESAELRLLVNLQTLVINYNQISEINNETLRSNNRLEELQMNYNDLTELTTEMFSSVPLLRILAVGNNKIDKIERGFFSSTPSLRNLHLSENVCIGGYYNYSGVTNWTQADSDLESCYLNFDSLTTIIPPGDSPGKASTVICSYVLIVFYGLLHVIILS